MRSRSSCRSRRGRSPRCESGDAHPCTAVAMTGKTVSPGLFEVAALLGRERVRRGCAARSHERGTARVSDSSSGLPGVPRAKC
jgi:hypothetical protein